MDRHRRAVTRRGGKCGSGATADDLGSNGRGSTGCGARSPAGTAAGSRSTLCVSPLSHSSPSPEPQSRSRCVVLCTLVLFHKVSLFCRSSSPSSAQAPGGSPRVEAQRNASSEGVQMAVWTHRRRLLRPVNVSSATASAPSGPLLVERCICMFRCSFVAGAQFSTHVPGLVIRVIALQRPRSHLVYVYQVRPETTHPLFPLIRTRP